MEPERATLNTPSGDPGHTQESPAADGSRAFIWRSCGQDPAEIATSFSTTQVVTPRSAKTENPRRRGVDHKWTLKK